MTPTPTITPTLFFISPTPTPLTFQGSLEVASAVGKSEAVIFVFGALIAIGAAIAVLRFIIRS